MIKLNAIVHPVIISIFIMLEQFKPETQERDLLTSGSFLPNSSANIDHIMLTKNKVNVPV